MELRRGDSELEQLVSRLADPEELRRYRQPFDKYPVGAVPRVLGSILIVLGTLVYGRRASVPKFRAIEVIARVPYHSWESAAYTLLTLFYSHEEKAIQLSERSRFARVAQDNETMHVVVISALARAEGRSGFIRYSVIPAVFSFFYFWAAYLLYLIRPRWSLELNYLFEQHAFEQYSQFLREHESRLTQTPINSRFLTWYGRSCATQYDFFLSVRNDEIIHRNRSIEEIKAL